MGSTAKKNVLLSHLLTEIVEFQILTRLAVKSLLRFKSVCKSWKSLISENQVFMHTHLANSNNDDCLMLRSRTRTGDPTQILIGCINGLLCFLTLQTFGIKFTISNPATKHLLDIRVLPVKSNAKYATGFGFDSITNDYKVVCMRTIMDQPLVGLMYSTSAHRWKKIAPSNFHYTGMFILNSRQPVIVNQSLYWLNLQTDSISLTVISFDFRHQVFRMLPDSFDKEVGKDHVLVNMRGSVALMCYNRTSFVGSTIDIYIFNERCSMWSKMYIGPLIGKEPSFGPLIKFMVCLRNNDMLFGGIDLKLYRLNPETHTINSIESSEEKGRKIIKNCCTYSESLIFIQGMETLPLYDNDDGDLIDTALMEKHYLQSGLICKCSCIQI